MKRNLNGRPALHEVEQNIIRKISSYCKIEIGAIDPLAPMDQIALDSILAITIIEELQHEYEVDLPNYLFYEHETIRSSAKYILGLIETAHT
jgi:acyl carrier protein